MISHHSERIDTVVRFSCLIVDETDRNEASTRNFKFDGGACTSHFSFSVRTERGCISACNDQVLPGISISLLNNQTIGQCYRIANYRINVYKCKLLREERPVVVVIEIKVEVEVEALEHSDLCQSFKYSLTTFSIMYK
ncbi:hypothetical protein KQX54_020772 [Cotesia glomerata]|uniref:ZP domain-containing protein n=1 Tax=Cotesia glomerata TaxID=32391 RepID=A0AAV7J7Y4_COTGL|nr:hypothetical protein KQX54_020772 [Cotesia glomerata]